MNTNNLPVIKFDPVTGIISNNDEIFADVPYGTLDRAGNRGRSVDAWINEEDKIVCELLNKHYFVWGHVLVGQGENKINLNIDGSPIGYRIHRRDDSHMEQIVKNQSSGTLFY